MIKSFAISPSLLSPQGLAQAKIQIRGELSLIDLDDVDLTGLSNGEVLVYNGTTEKWEPTTVGGVLPSNLLYVGDDVSDLVNDAGYLTTIKGENISDLTNDSGYIKPDEIPVDGVTITYNTAGKIQAIGDGQGLVAGDNVSLLTNDIGYLTSVSASEVLFDANTSNQLSADNVQEAIEEVNDKIEEQENSKADKCFVTAMALAF